ncbi:hypothetical protein B0H67DRAFT_263977 [Lasiosphaeris hirsuta]|uniref:SET domain-containing protein n=1 Tax=Lasiosphaeris hirsuta TaxID=260670 RepID=A0AA40A7H1_9PEZI|nr:hypothetical protein B0H67DRAFT_263977 [Lasiosphaeris hirsuta]
MTFEAVAYVDINPGEELTISYLPLNLLSEDRKSSIKKWHFNCTCPVCSSGAEMEQSDINKLRIQGILDELRLKDNRTHAGVGALVDELMAILDTERLQVQTGNFASILAGVYFQMEDLAKARGYAKQAVDNHMYYIGHDNEKVQEALQMLEFLQTIEYR